MRPTTAALELTAAAAALQVGFAYLLAAAVSRAETRETHELAAGHRPHAPLH